MGKEYITTLLNKRIPLNCVLCIFSTSGLLHKNNSVLIINRYLRYDEGGLHEVLLNAEGINSYYSMIDNQ